MNNTASFSINVQGETTQTNWIGDFSAKIRLSHADEMQRDRLRKDFLGPNPEDSSPRAKDQAEVFSQLAVRIVKAPLWWKESRGGLELSDDNVIAKVYEEALRIEREALEELQKKAKEAQEALSKPQE